MEKQQKSVEDYRNIIKLLKLKVMKLQKKNQELEQKLYEPLDDSYIMGESQQDIQAGKIQSAWRNKNQVDPANQTEGILMQDLYKGCRKMGISTEGLFRAADKERAKVIPTEEFKFFLKNCRLSMTQGQINRLAAMADEECCGKISEQNWHNLLEMYEVSQETKSTDTRSFAQKSLFMLANIFVDKKISPEQGFEEIARGHTTITNDRLKAYCLNEDKSMTERHCSSAFNHLDFNKKGRISKEFFTGEVRKAMRISAQEKGLQISQFCPPQEQVVSRPQQSQQPVQQQYQQPQQQQNNSLMPGKQRMNMSSSRKAQNQTMDQSMIVPEFQIDKVDAAQVIKSLKNYNVDIGKLFQAMLDELVNPKAGVRIKDVFNAFNTIQNGKSVPKNVQLSFFKCLDTNGNGGADFNEALEFYCYYMDINNDDSWPLELVYGMKKCHLDATLTTIDEYLEQFQITHETDLNEKTFKYQAKRMFNIKKEKTKVMEKVAHKVEGKGNINNAFRNARISKKKKIVKKKKQQLPVDLNEFGKNLAKVREEQGKPYELEPSDFFTKFKLESDTSGGAIEKPWATILNDEIACLIKCMEIIKELKDRKLEKWTDPEFGPNDNDKVGASALYFTDNDIPPGAPKPEEVIWMRPEELIQTLRDMGVTYKVEGKDEDGNDLEADYEDKEPIFLEGGASSNDVQQSQYLGDCWFISALSIIAQDDNLIDGNFDPDEEKIKNISDKEAKGMASGVYPPMFHFMEQYGVYVLRFFKNAGWRYVIVDDRIPCKEGGEVIYGQCKQKNELWVPIIEKAFAKIHNSYQALIAGDIAQGLADMTGMIADKTKLHFQNLRTKPEDEMTEDEKAKLTEDLKQEATEADQLWEKLKEAKKNLTMMGCSAEGATEGFIDIEGENSGVMSGHAYSLLDVIELPYLEEEKSQKKGRGFHRLLRIRNPWGHGEWKFKWSDTGDEFKEQTLKHKKDIDQYYENQRKQAEQWNKEHPDEDPIDLNEFESIDIGADDGTFLMNFKEWRQLFANLFQCINFPDDWSGKRIQGLWQDKYNFGPPKKGGLEKYALENPQYIFEIKRTKQKGIKDKNTTQVYINLTQRDGRMFWGEKYPYDRVTTYMLLCVFKLDEGEAQLSKFDKKKCDAAGSSKSLILRREVDSDFMDLPDGKYAIIPCAKVNGYVGQFTLNIYFDCHENDIKFKGANNLECVVTDIAEESEEITHISEEKRWIYQDLAKKELQMVTEKRKKYGKKK